MKILKEDYRNMENVNKDDIIKTLQNMDMDISDKYKTLFNLKNSIYDISYDAVREAEEIMKCFNKVIYRLEDMINYIKNS